MNSIQGQKFTTKDKDNDKQRGRNCAVYRGGGWWHNACGGSSLNGQYIPYKNRDNPGEGGIRWNRIKKDDYSFQFSEMKIKRA